jgi:hypothetical protein
MSEGDSDFRIRPGRIKTTRAPKAKSFLNQVLRAAKKAGHTAAPTSGRRASGYGRSTFGRGRGIFSRSRLFSSNRRVIVKARVVRHHGRSFRSAPLPAHLSYLKREGVSRDGEKGVMFDAGRSRRRFRLCGPVQGRPTPFPLHCLARGCRRDDRPQGIHARSLAADGSRSRHPAELGCRRSLEHRQPSCPSSRTRRG